MKHKAKWPRAAAWLLSALVIAFFAGACGDSGGGNGGGREPVSIAVKTEPAKTVYTIGEALDLAGLVITAAYDDGTTEDITDTAKFTTSGFDSAAAGEKTVTVKYGGKTTTFTVTVEKPVKSIAITTEPTKKDYFVGDVLDPAGIRVTAAYNDGTTEVIAGDKLVISFDSATTGEKTVTVEYQGQKATFIVIVHAASDITLNTKDIVITDEGKGLAVFNIDPVSLSKGGKQTKTLNFTGTDCTAISWYVDNIDLENNTDTLILKALSFNPGKHTLSLAFTKNEKAWLANLDFTVTD